MGQSRLKGFRIEGKREALSSLASLILELLKEAETSPSPIKTRGTTQAGLLIEVAISEFDELRAAIEVRDDGADLLEGWAEPKHCVKCDELVALLFEDEYIESVEQDGMLCLRCARELLDRGEAI
jgi:hypothetical protein